MSLSVGDKNVEVQMSDSLVADSFHRMPAPIREILRRALRQPIQSISKLVVELI